MLVAGRRRDSQDPRHRCSFNTDATPRGSLVPKPEQNQYLTPIRTTGDLLGGLEQHPRPPASLGEEAMLGAFNVVNIWDIKISVGTCSQLQELESGLLSYRAQQILLATHET